MRKISRRETALLMILFVVLCGFLYYNFYFKGFQEKMDTLNTDIADTKQSLTTIRQENVALTAQKNSLDTLKGKSETELADVLSSYDQPQILYVLQNVATPLVSKYSVAFSQDYTDYGASRVYTVTLNATSSYENLKKLLQALKDCPYVNRVVTGDITRQEVQAASTPPPVDTTSGTSTPAAGETAATAGTTTGTVQMVQPTVTTPAPSLPPVMDAQIVIEFYCLNNPPEGVDYPFMNKTFDNQNLLSGEPGK